MRQHAANTAAGRAILAIGLMLAIVVAGAACARPNGTADQIDRVNAAPPLPTLAINLAPELEWTYSTSPNTGQTVYTTELDAQHLATVTVGNTVLGMTRYTVHIRTANGLLVAKRNIGSPEAAGAAIGQWLHDHQTKNRQRDQIRRTIANAFQNGYQSAFTANQSPATVLPDDAIPQPE